MADTVRCLSTFAGAIVSACFGCASPTSAPPTPAAPVPSSPHAATPPAEVPVAAAVASAPTDRCSGRQPPAAEVGGLDELKVLFDDLSHACLGDRVVDGAALEALRSALGDDLRPGGQPRMCRVGFTTLRLVGSDGRWARPQLCPNVEGEGIFQSTTGDAIVNTTLVVRDWPTLSSWLLAPDTLPR